MGKYQELLKKFYKETDFLAHSTAYEARTVQEFADWLDSQVRPTPCAADGCKSGQHLVLSGSNKCVNCGKRVNRRR